MKRLKNLFDRTARAVRGWAKRVYELRYLNPVLSVSGQTVKGFYRDDCHIMAAAISFYAVLSLIPFLLLLMSIAGFVLNSLGSQYASQEELFAHIATYVRAVVPFLSDEVMHRLSGIISNRGAYGITGLVILFITAGLVFRTLELAFARVFHTRRSRSMVASQLLFVVFILAVGLLFLAVHYFGVLSSSFYSARNTEFHERWDNLLSRSLPVRLVASVVTATSVFAVLLKYFSRERIKWKFALAGGLLFSLLWILAIRIFGYYLTNVARFSLLYGSLATLAIIVVWIFYSSCILLLCAEFTGTLQKRFNMAAENQSGS